MLDVILDSNAVIKTKIKNIKGNTKFWDILKIGWKVILYNIDIFDASVDVL